MMKKDHARSGFVSELLFDTNGNYPYSEQLDQILQQFQLCGVLSRPNPTYKYNDISISPGPSNQQLRGSLSPEQQGAYRLMADDFKEKLGVPAKAKQR
jgi:hypothetical protein